MNPFPSGKELLKEVFLIWVWKNDFREIHFFFFKDQLFQEETFYEVDFYSLISNLILKEFQYFQILLCMFFIDYYFHFSSSILESKHKLGLNFFWTN